MNLINLLSKNDSSRAPSWKGTWARIWVKPSIFSAQTFIIGLAVFDETGLSDYKLISDTIKFNYIYDESGQAVVNQLLAEARLCLGSARENRRPLTTMMLPPGLQIDPVGYISGQSNFHAMEEALNEAEIPMEPKPEEFKLARFKSRKPDEVTKSIIDEIKKKIGFQADQFIRETHFSNSANTAGANLILPHSVGMIASGWYSEPHRVQLELFKAANTVELYSAQSEKNGKPGLFFLRPTEKSGLRLEQSKQIENSIDEIDWRLGRKGFKLAIREFENDLAEDVANWINS